MFPKLPVFLIALSFSVINGVMAQVEPAYELMRIEDVKPGMEGEWRTVISGTEIQSFPLRVIGIA